MQSIRRGFTMFFAIPLVIGSVIFVGGCEQKEKVIDIETERKRKEPHQVWEFPDRSIRPQSF